MTDTEPATPGPVQTWRPEPRPEWARRLNRVGATLGDLDQVVPLDEASLLGAATSITGLEDFGPEEWREPFRILLADIGEHARLNLIGRLLARRDIVHCLVVRLQMAETEKQHPEILEQPIVAPVLITGMGRTGTSILYELMAEDPQWRVPTAWELRYPSPPPEAATRDHDPRITEARDDLALWYDVVPELLGIHELASEGAEEDVVALEHEFVAASWSALHKAPNLDMYVALQGAEQTYRHHRRIFQHLQFRAPGRWLWKGPAHLSTLHGFLTEYPDARIVMTHRDPIKILPSTANLISTLRWQRSDHVDHLELAQMLGFGLPLLFDMVADQRSSGALPDERFTDVRFADLMDDHISAIGAIYDGLGLELSDDAADRMRAYLAAKPKGRHGGGAYRFEDTGLDLAGTRSQFAAYMDRFDVPEED
jgi:hypothetical protein